MPPSRSVPFGGEVERGGTMEIVCYGDVPLEETVKLVSKRGGRRTKAVGQKNHSPEGKVSVPTRESLGIERKDAERSQAIARVPEAKFAKYLAERKDEATRGELVKLQRREEHEKIVSFRQACVK